MASSKNPKKPSRARSTTAQTVDFKELLEAIDNYAETPEWKELPFAGKVRVLLRRVLDVEARAQEQKVAALKSFVQAIANQRRPTEPDCILVAHFLEMDIEVLHALIDKVIENGHSKESANVQL